MNMILDTILKEKIRIEYMLEKYYKIIDDLPKGSLHVSDKNGQKYYDLKYREGKKIITKYIGKDAEDMANMIEKRRHTEAMIKSLEAERRIAVKALEGNV